MFGTGAAGSIPRFESTLCCKYNRFEHRTLKRAGAAPFDFADEHALDMAVWLMIYAAFASLLAYVALIFRRIARAETPFVKELPRKIKTAAAMLFLAVALPRWIGYALLSFATGSASFAIFDEVNLPALIAAAMMFSLGQVFEYGYLVQDENYEII